MKTKFLLVSACSVIATGLVGCANSSSDSPSAATQTAKYDAQYQGTLPCADCDGVVTTLTLNPDGTFFMESEYLANKPVKFSQKGKYTEVEEGVVELTLDNNDKVYYQIEEGEAIMLDQNRKAPTGALADHYVLKQSTTK